MSTKSKKPKKRAKSNSNPQGSSAQRALRLVVYTLFGIFIGLPLAGVGAATVWCNVGRGLNSQTSAIKKDLKEATSGQTHISARAFSNGDCLTGSGTTVEVTLKKDYASLVDAEEELDVIIATAGLPMPDKTVPLTYVGGGKGNSSGGDTPLAYFRYTRRLSDYSTYEYKYTLRDEIACEIKNAELSPTSGKVIKRNVTCDNGIPQNEVKSIDYMKNKPITALNFYGHVREGSYGLYQNAN